MEELKKDLSIPWNFNLYLRGKRNSYTEYVRCWSIHDGEPIRRTFAYKTIRGTKQVWIEVMRETPTSEACVSQNIYYNGMSGYTTVFDRHVRTNHHGYRPFDPEDFNRWMSEPKSLGMSVVDELDKDAYTYCEKYKHCGYQESCGDLLEYLRAYNKDPAVEYFGKLGLKPEKSYMRLAKKDKQFVRFLKDNLWEVKERNPEVVLHAYRHHICIAEAGNVIAKKRTALSTTLQIKNVKELKLDRVKVYEYLRDNLISTYLYDDYLECIKTLGLDTKDTKNVFPKDFFRMHDMRVDECTAYKAKQKKEEQRKLDKDFAKKVKEYVELEDSGKSYIVILPKQTGDLVREGDRLHHCVGKMGYDAKVIRGESIIVFVRKAEDPRTPYVTVEYKPGEKKVTQCYGEHDTKPSEDVLRYVERWEKKVTKILKERAKNEKNNVSV